MAGGSALRSANRSQYRLDMGTLRTLLVWKTSVHGMAPRSAVAYVAMEQASRAPF